MSEVTQSPSSRWMELTSEQDRIREELRHIERTRLDEAEERIELLSVTLDELGGNVRRLEKTLGHLLNLQQRWNQTFGQAAGAAATDTDAAMSILAGPTAPVPPEWSQEVAADVQ